MCLISRCDTTSEVANITKKHHVAFEEEKGVK